MGDEACSRIGIGPVRGHHVLKWLLVRVHSLLHPMEKIDPRGLGRLGEIMFQDMISKAYNGEVTFTVPTTLKALKAIVRNSKSPAVA